MKTLLTHVFVPVKGDIFTHIKKAATNNVVIVPHVCSSGTAFNGGFVKKLSERYPIVEANFQVNVPAKIGHTQYVNVADSLYVSSMIAQGILNKNRKDRRILHYPSLIKCMYDVKNYTKKLSGSTETSVQIHAPKFGVGLSGGNWNFISDLIDDIWFDIPTFIYEY